MKQVKTNQIFFCSAASRYFKEEIHGSAANYKGFILLEHSDPFPEKVQQAHFDAEWLAQLQELAKRKKAKLLLIRNKKTDYRTARLLYVDCIKQQYFKLHCTPQVLKEIQLEKYMEDPLTVWHSDPFFVVCTNGKKDKCCAKFGFPVFKFFEKHPQQVTVWECTHVGGDRFAANAVCMPFGVYYGRVMVEDVDNIIQHTHRNEVFYPNYRGLTTRSFFEQAVECHMRDHLKDASVYFNFEITQQVETGTQIQVWLTISTGKRFYMELVKQTIPYPYYLTCKATKAGNITKYQLVGLEALP